MTSRPITLLGGPFDGEIYEIDIEWPFVKFPRYRFGQPPVIEVYRQEIRREDGKMFYVHSSIRTE